MSQGAYIAIGVIVIVALLAIFIISFILYRRTPVPKGCEDIKISEENCSSCGHTECQFYKKKDAEE
ncbi:MAG: hypothetical protein K5925_00340 [Bacilli bacterium]|nr:hypothetical protein [Bacilli bacterium]